MLVAGGGLADGPGRAVGDALSARSRTTSRRSSATGRSTGRSCCSTRRPTRQRSTARRSTAATVDYVPLDVHVGSIAIQRFIERRQPLITLHGHVHESARLTGAWRTVIGDTWAFSAAHDGPELALVRFDPEQLDAATRELL